MTYFCFSSYFKVFALNLKRSETAIVHDIDDDDDDAYYIDDIQNDYYPEYTQGESTNSPLFDFKFLPKGENPFGKIQLNSFGDAMEELMENDEQIWKTLFQHH